jgi:hypothetical protein
MVVYQSSDKDRTSGILPVREHLRPKPTPAAASSTRCWVISRDAERRVSVEAISIDDALDLCVVGEA